MYNFAAFNYSITIMKKCNGCSEIKPLSEYYKHPATADGFATKCKACAKAIVKNARQKNKEHYAAFERDRANRPDRVAARVAYQRTDRGKEAARRAREKYKAKAPERRAAHVAVGNAVRDGRLIPWPVCAIPECDCAPEAHHPDYSRPLEVVWLCGWHHIQAHKLAREIARSI